MADLEIRDLRAADPLRATLLGSVLLDGVRLGLRCWMNPRSFRWSLDILDSASRPLVEGHALVSNADVLRPYRSTYPGLPLGLLFCVDTTGAGRGPSGFTAWRDTHRLLYRPAADL